MRISIEDLNGCWEWSGALTAPDGHGCISINGKKSLVHRVMYAMFYGAPDQQQEIRHKCDNPKCVNPFHLETGTHAENMNDRALRTGVINRKLTTQMILDIRNSKQTQRYLSEHYGVSQATIHNVITGKTYRHVTS